MHSEKTFVVEIYNSKSMTPIMHPILQEILKTGRGESMDVLYKALTKGGDERYIYRNIQGLPTEGRREWQGNILRDQIAQDPTFADTLSHKEGKERLAPQKSITSGLLRALGIYKGGGFLGFGKKKEKDKDEALVALEAILSDGYELKEGKHEFPMGYTVSQDYLPDDSGREIFRLISKLATPEGDRYYPGEGKSRSFSLGQTKAMMDAASRAYHSPADSITTNQLEKLRELGLFGE